MKKITMIITLIMTLSCNDNKYEAMYELVSKACLEHKWEGQTGGDGYFSCFCADL